MNPKVIPPSGRRIVPITHIAEIEDPVTGERIVVEAATDAELQDKVDRELASRYPLPGGPQ